MRSENPHLRREYNRFRVRVGSVLRDLAALDTTGDASLRLLALDQIRVDARNAEQSAESTIDRLIREDAISADVATSLTNDSNYTKIVVDSLVDMAEAWNKAILSDSKLEDVLSLDPEEIEVIARQVH